MGLFNYQSAGRFDVSSIQKETINRQLQENILQLAYNRFFLRIPTPGAEKIFKMYGRGMVGFIRVNGEKYEVRISKRGELIVKHN